MKILFKTNFSQTKIEIDLKPTDNGSTIRSLLAEKLSVQPEELVVNYWGDVIQDDVTVEFYKMKEGDEIGYEIEKKKLKQAKTSNGEGAEEVKAEEITIKLKNKDTITEINVFGEDSIAMVKQKIATKFGYPVEGVMIKFNNYGLFPSKKLEDYRIGAGSELELIIDEKMVQNALEQKKKDEEKKKVEAKSVQVKVKFSGEDSFEVSIAETATVKQLIEKITAEKNETKKLELIIEGKIAKDNDPLDLWEVKKITIFVKREGEKHFFLKRTIGGSPILVIIDPNSTVDEVKALVEKQDKIPKADQVFKNKGEELKGDVKISELELQDGGNLEFATAVKKSMFMNNKK